MNPSVVLTGTMDPQLRQTLEHVCAHEGLRCVAWNTSQVLAPHEQHFVVLAGELPAGARNVPESLSELATRQFPQASMILFCKEQLARKAKSIQNGRLTLVGPPPDAETVAKNLRAAFGMNRATEQSKNGSTSEIRQLRGRRWWAGSVSRLSGAETDSKRIGAPYVEGLPEKGLAFWLPDANVNLDVAQIETGLELMGADVFESRFAKGDMAPLAAMTLRLSDNCWRVFSTHPHVQCWLVSQKRFPRAWRLSMTEPRNSVQRFAAASGDILALWHAPRRNVQSSADDSTRLDPELLLASECGGHALLDLLNSRCSKLDSAFCAIVAEMRQEAVAF